MAAPCQTPVEVSQRSASIWKCRLTLNLDPPSRPSSCTHAIFTTACHSCDCGESEQSFYSNSLVKQETVVAAPLISHSALELKEDRFSDP